MNESMLQKIWGDIRTRIGRTALVSISIFIGVLGVVTLISAGDILVKQLKADIREDELPMLYMFVTIPGDETGDIDNAAALDQLRTFPNITKVEGQANYPFYWKQADETRFRDAYINAFSEPFEDLELTPTRLVEGRYPEAGNQELVVEQRMAEDFGLKVGDQMDVRILSSAQAGQDLVVEQWTVVGIVFHPYSQFPDETVFTAYDDARYIANFAGLSSIDARFENYEIAQASVDDFSLAIAEETPYIVVFNFSEDPAKNQAVESTEQYATILGLLAIVAMVVSGFLVINVINNIVVEQKRQIGVMKSLGARRRQAFLIYAGIALTYGLFGMIPGVLLGIPAGYKMAQIVGDFANTLITDFTVSPLGVGLGIVLGIAVPVISAVLPVFNGTRVTILEAMTDLGISGGYRVGPVARLIRALPLPVTMKQSLSNINHKKWRLALTVVTLTMAITAFMGVSAVFVRINEVLQDILETFSYEIQLQPTQSQSYDKVNNLLLNNIDGIKEVYPATALQVQLEGYRSQFTDTNQLILTGIEPSAQLLEFDLTEGTGWDTDPNRRGTVLSSGVANQIKKGVGETVMFHASGKQLELEIIGIANFPFDVAFMPWRDLARFAGYTSGAPTPNQYFANVELNGEPVTAWGIDDQVMTAVDFVDFALPTSQEQSAVMISQGLAESGGYQVGDDITLASGDRSETLPVLAIFTPKDTLADLTGRGDLPEQVVALPWEDLAALENVSLEGEPVPNVFLIVAEDRNMTAREVDDMIEDVNDLLVQNGITSSFFNTVEFADQASNVILSIGIILNMASLVMAAVGAIGLLTTLSISVYERQKEIGVMRSIGAGSWTIIMQFLVEGVFVGIIAWIVAAPLSVGLAYVLTNALPFGEFIEFAFPWLILPAGLVGILVIATISSIWPSVAASRKTVSDILRYQ
jgi:putative ABC transport system permease protein